MSGKRHPKGYLRELVERAKVDPEGVRRELEAKGDLSQTEFAILEALRSSEKGRPCKRCGKPFIPNTATQVFCSKSCRVVYYVIRYIKRNKWLFRSRHKWRAKHDPSYRNRWMARLNKLRLKAGRLPYWNTSENRPYTKEELEYMERTNRILRKGGWTDREFYERQYLGLQKEPKQKWNVTVVLPRKEEKPAGETLTPKPSMQTFILVHDTVVGVDVTYKIAIKPNSNCKHTKTRTLFVGERERRAFVCLDCGAIRFPDEGREGKWHYFVDADIHAKM